MTAVEIVLVVIGVIMMVASFFITEKLSNGELNKIAELSQDELQRILEHKLKEVGTKVNEVVEDAIDEAVEQAVEKVQRSLDKETNEKIKAISEYSDTVLESIHKTHNEVMFLYSMLNDKHTELTDYAARLTKLATGLSNVQEQIEKTIVNSQESMRQAEEKAKEVKVLPEIPAVVEEVPEAEPEKVIDQKQLILTLYKEGKSTIEIARKLGLGIGEVKLVIGLFREEEM